MSNKYVDFVSDQHLLKCIENLFNSYQRAQEEITIRRFYNNKIDVFKFLFDSKFTEIDEIQLLEVETLRQADKTINNFIGTFHEEVLGGIEGYERGNASGYDIKASDNSLFADIKNKHNTMNSGNSESLFQKLARFADDNKNARCYWVQILAKGSFDEHWKAIINGKEYSHSRVFKISSDKFYGLLTGDEFALVKLYKALPTAIDDFLQSQSISKAPPEQSATSEIEKEAKLQGRSIIDQMTYDNFRYYSGFKDL